MDFLSRTWCNFAVQALQPDLQDQSMVVLDNQIAKLESNTMTAPYMVWYTLRSLYMFLFVIRVNEIENGVILQCNLQKLDKSVKMEGPDVKSLPQWKSNDVKVIKLHHLNQ